MTYDQAIGVISQALDAIPGFPAVSDRPLNPDNAPDRALYLYDDEETLQAADILRSHTSEATATATVLIKVVGTPGVSAAKVLRQQIDLVIEAMHALSKTAPGFTVFVSRVRYAYDLAHASWAAAFLTLTVEAYRK